MSHIATFPKKKKSLRIHSLSLKYYSPRHRFRPLPFSSLSFQPFFLISPFLQRHSLSFIGSSALVLPLGVPCILCSVKPKIFLDMDWEWNMTKQYSDILHTLFLNSPLTFCPICSLSYAFYITLGLLLA